MVPPAAISQVSFMGGAYQKQNPSRPLAKKTQELVGNEVETVPSLGAL